jgi:predicted ATPase/DNA-binding winged helix-turn-helix (wHTH) protein
MDVDTAVVFGRFTLLPARRQLLVDGQPAAIGSRAFDLLQALIERRDRSVAKDELLDVVWPDVIVEEANLHVQISALRKVLGPAAIATLPGRGYRFVAPLDLPASVPPTVAPAPESTLPAPGTALIGRDDALRALIEQVCVHQLVTITGPGGIGKTRLAVALAGALATHFADGVAWVELAAIRDASLVISTVAQALRLGFPDGADGQRLARALQGRAMLVVLDNAEHVLDAVGELVQVLRKAALQVHVLLTSQEALHVQGEQVFALEPLSLPAPQEAPDDSFGAIRLFVERAHAADRRFVLDANNAPSVADICRRLDGLPLAIELAAARVPLLGVHGLRERLERQLDLLTRGARDAIPRHQTLRSALAWSHSLLEPIEMRVLRRLGVFVGGFTLELAQAVAADTTADEWAVLDALGGLIDKSLVTVDVGEPVRYRLLETMRIFALERLDEAGERAQVEQLHARAVAALFERVDEERFGDVGRATASDVTRQLQPEVDNAGVALDWAIRNEDAPLTATLAGSAAAVFHAAGRVQEILPVLRSCLPRLADAPANAQVNVLWRLGALGLFGAIPHEQLQHLKLEAVAAARRLGLRRRLQVSLSALGFTLARRGDTEAARKVIMELQSLERTDDPVYVRALALSVPMMLAQHLDDVDAVIDSLGRQRALLLGAPDELVPLLTCEANLAMHLNAIGSYEEASRLALAWLARPNLPRTFVQVPCAAAYALSCLGRVAEARDVIALRKREIAATPISAFSGEALAMMCLADARLDDAVRIDAALEQRTANNGGTSHPLTRAFRERLAAAVDVAGVTTLDVERWRREGTLLSDAAAVDLALRSGPH